MEVSSEDDFKCTRTMMRILTVTMICNILALISNS